MVAKRYRALEMRVIAHDPYVRKEDVEAIGVQLTDLETLLKESDIVSIHTLLSKETFHLIGEKELGLMKKTAIIVNTARGKLIDQKALYDALKEKRIAAAGLDVLENEPPEANDPILKLDNVVLTPHIAWLSLDSTNNLRTMVSEKTVSRFRATSKAPGQPASFAEEGLASSLSHQSL